MKYHSINALFLLMIINLLPINSHAAGLQEFLEKNKTTQVITSNTQETPPTIETQKIIDKVNSINTNTGQLTHIIEMVVAGVVASALIISLLILFLGRWAATKDRIAIKAIRQESEDEKEHITASATTIREQEKETTKIVRAIRDKAKEISAKEEQIQKQEKQIDITYEKTQQHHQELKEVSSSVGERMTKIQTYWDEQLHDTVSAIQQVQNGLNDSLNKVDDGLDKMQRQKSMSEELMQDFLRRHNEQNTVLENNSKISDQVSESLEETLKESTQLLQLLKKQQKNAEKALHNFNEELSGFEEQAYEQFDSSFQVADIARQELSANIEESRKHMKTMRRYEEQSHSINAQTHKHLESLDFTKIVKLSHTLNSTQDMFTDLRDSVEEAQHMLDDLKDIETDIRETAINVKKEVETIDVDAAMNSENSPISAAKNSKTDDTKLLNVEILPKRIKPDNLNINYKIASGDNTPLSFFRHTKPRINK